MKNVLRTAFATALMTVVLVGCSKKVLSPEMQKLQNQKEVLELNTELNKFNLSLEKELQNIKGLVADVNKANEKAAESASESQNKAEELAANAGDTRLASRADKAARRAAKDAKRALNINEDLSDANDDVKDYQKDIQKTQEKLNDLQSKINFVPNK